MRQSDWKSIRNRKDGLGVNDIVQELVNHPKVVVLEKRLADAFGDAIFDDTETVFPKTELWLPAYHFAVHETARRAQIPGDFTDLMEALAIVNNRRVSAARPVADFPVSPLLDDARPVGENLPYAV